jgi:hypothetical protein
MNTYSIIFGHSVFCCSIYFLLLSKKVTSSDRVNDIISFKKYFFYRLSEIITVSIKCWTCFNLSTKQHQVKYNHETLNKIQNFDSSLHVFNTFFQSKFCFFLFKCEFSFHSLQTFRFFSIFSAVRTKSFSKAFWLWFQCPFWDEPQTSSI